MKPEFFGQYGKITNCIVNYKPLKTNDISDEFYAAYITYSTPAEASLAILSVDNTFLDDTHCIRATFGNTKFCDSYLKGKRCMIQNCLFVHNNHNSEVIPDKEDSNKTSYRELRIKAAKIANLFDSENKKKLLSSQTYNNSILPHVSSIYTKSEVLLHEKVKEFENHNLVNINWQRNKLVTNKTNLVKNNHSNNLSTGKSISANGLKDLLKIGEVVTKEISTSSKENIEDIKKKDINNNNNSKNKEMNLPLSQLNLFSEFVNKSKENNIIKENGENNYSYRNEFSTISYSNIENEVSINNKEVKEKYMTIESFNSLNKDELELLEVETKVDTDQNDINIKSIRDSEDFNLNTSEDNIINNLSNKGKKASYNLNTINPINNLDTLTLNSIDILNTLSSLEDSPLGFSSDITKYNNQPIRSIDSIDSNKNDNDNNNTNNNTNNNNNNTNNNKSKYLSNFILNYESNEKSNVLNESNMPNIIVRILKNKNKNLKLKNNKYSKICGLLRKNILNLSADGIGSTEEESKWAKHIIESSEDL